jgi:hypothetical protein
VNEWMNEWLRKRKRKENSPDTQGSQNSRYCKILYF